MNTTQQTSTTDTSPSRERERVMSAFLDGHAVLADLYQLTRRELFEIAAHAQKLLEAGQIANAERAFSGLVALDPTISSFHVGLGVVLARLGETDRAIEEYDRAVQLDRRDIAARANRAELLIGRGELLAAIEDLRVIESIDPRAEQQPTRYARRMAVALERALARIASPE